MLFEDKGVTRPEADGSKGNHAKSKLRRRVQHGIVTDEDREMLARLARKALTLRVP